MLAATTEFLIIVALLVAWGLVYYCKEKLYEKRLQRREEAMYAWRKKGKSRWMRQKNGKEG